MMSSSLQSVPELDQELMIAIFSLLFHVSATSKSFRPVKMPNEFSMCAVDNPAYSLFVDDILGFPSGVPNGVRCAYRCTTDTAVPCMAFNVNNTHCQFYNSTMNHCFAASTTCVYIQVFCASSATGCVEAKVTNPVASANACSFPFTLNGQLYHQCTANYTATTCNVGCFLMNQTWATCTVDSMGYVAQNTTVRVNIASSTGITIVSLRSVNGWLSILSRVDANFQYNQDFAAYQLGFGNITSNFWLGLENIYRLTNSAVNGGRQYRLRIEMLQNITNKWISVEYAWFSIGSNSTTYTLYVASTSTGDADDMLNYSQSPSNGQTFKTSGTCSSDLGFWWYKASNSCGGCRFFGIKFGWWTFDLRIVRMMVKQLN